MWGGKSMLNLIRKDFLLVFSSNSTIFMFLFFLPFFQFILGSDNSYSVPLISIMTIGYMLTTMSFNFEIKNKPYVMIRSLPIKTGDVVIAKYVKVFLNYILAVTYTFIYMKILNLIGFSISGHIDIFILKQSLVVIMMALSISLPLHFCLPAKIANFVNIFIYISLMNYFSIKVASIFLGDLSDIVISLIIIAIFGVSLGLSTLIYKFRDLS